MIMLNVIMSVIVLSVVAPFIVPSGVVRNATKFHISTFSPMPFLIIWKSILRIKVQRDLSLQNFNSLGLFLSSRLSSFQSICIKIVFFFLKFNIYVFNGATTLSITFK
jgi:hypothetical protein